MRWHKRALCIFISKSNEYFIVVLVVSIVAERIREKKGPKLLSISIHLQMYNSTLNTIKWIEFDYLKAPNATPNGLTHDIIKNLHPYPLESVSSVPYTTTHLNVTYRCIITSLSFVCKGISRQGLSNTEVMRNNLIRSLQVFPLNKIWVSGQGRLRRAPHLLNI